MQEKTKHKTYLFTSERLGFRSWNDHDLSEFAAMNANPKVMQHFPNTLSIEESKDFLMRLQVHHQRHGYCYFATERLDTQDFIGFIGLAHQSYKAPFTPATDIGWRLKPSAWGKGFATEGAKRCLNYAFDTLQIKRIIATCTKENKTSECVMQKIGMTYKGEFTHPKLIEFPHMQPCLWYEIEPPN